MVKFMLPLLAVIILALALATTSAAVSLNDTQGYLVAHNKARAAVKVGPLVWSLNLALRASRIVQDQANQNRCNFTELEGVNLYGVNQLQASGLILCTPPVIVDQWLGQEKNYDPIAKSCAPNKQCGSYRQVVSRKSVFLGCAEATCTGNGGCLAICLYNPSGN